MAATSPIRDGDGDGDGDTNHGARDPWDWRATVHRRYNSLANSVDPASGTWDRDRRDYVKR